MSKKFNIYNSSTKQWEEISHANTVSKNKVDATDVIVNNGNFTDDEGNEVTLDDTLTVISDDISNLQRDVSWLSEHGGNGGTTIIISGSTGSTDVSTYGIVVQSPSISNGDAYIDSSVLTVKFSITGGTSTDTYKYRISYDGYYVTDYLTISDSTQTSVTISNIETYKTSVPHTMIIEAKTSGGNSISSCSFNIYERSIKLSIDSEYQSVSISESGTIYLNLTSKILGTTNIYFKNTTINTEDIYTFTNKKTSEQTIQYSLFDNLLGDDLQVTASYSITAYASVTLENGSVINSDTITFRVTIVGGDKITIMFNGITSQAEINDGYSASTFNLGDSIVYGFRLFYEKATSKYLYYAGKIVTPENNEFLVIGNYFDDNLHGDGYTTYTSNPSTISGALISNSYPINSINFNVNNGYKLIIKAWDYSGNESVSNSNTAIFNIIESSTDFYSFQNPGRTQNTEENTLLARWSKENLYGTYTYTWPSEINGYLPIGKTNQETSAQDVKLNIDVYDANGSVSGLFTNPSKLRLQNSAYAKIDLTDYLDEIKSAFANKYDGSSYVSYYKDGFTLSITFTTDEHSSNDKTVFLFGVNDVDGELSQGMRIDLEKVYWYIKTNEGYQKLSGSIRQTNKTTVDFVWDAQNGIAKILINGVINGAAEIGCFGDDYDIPSEIYLGCNYANGEIYNFSDVNIYELSIFTKTLSDIEAVINGKNSRIEDKTDSDTIEEYAKWKKRNLFISQEDNSVKNMLYEDDYISPTYADLKTNNPPMPIIYLECITSTNGFTKEYFTSTDLDAKTATATTFPVKYMYYYDNETGKEVIVENVEIAIQGTSTTGYRSKNLELYIKGASASDANKTQLFQPKSTWLPEREFTLKADVVDSSHANNATIGYWINNYGSKIMENNPAMDLYSGDNGKKYRPKDIANGVTYTHTASDTTLGEIDYDDKVTIKHTLEGFPVMLIVKFADGITEFIGNYSFNLGRYSYFNMGLSFLKSFSRRNETDNYSADNGCPAVIDWYEEYGRDETIGNIKLSNIYSFEFGANGTENSSKYPAWSQDDVSVIKHYGDFKFNGALGNDDEPSSDVWNKLKVLFSQTSRCEPCYGEYEVDANGNYVYKDTKYSTGDEYYTNLIEHLSIQNAMAYFDIVNAFGLVDSLGKNLTIRTWDLNKWWTAFYDMDTGLALTNAGGEGVTSIAYIDKIANTTYYNYTDDDGNLVSTKDYSSLPRTSTGEISVNYTETWSVSDGYNIFNESDTMKNSTESEFGAYNSKLWNILRNVGNNRFLYLYNGSNTYSTSYETIWVKLRTNVLTSYSDFVDLLEEQVGGCGEMLYNYDYKYKYLTKYYVVTDGKKATTATYGNIEMLHGTRIEYIRNWLKKRLYFLDGILSVSSVSTSEAIDMPYYTAGKITSGGHATAIGGIPLTLRSSYPCIMTVVVGSNGTTYRYFLNENTDTTLIFPEFTYFDTRMDINNYALLTKIDGLYGIRFQKLESIFFSSLEKFDIHNVSYLESNGIDFVTVFTSTSDIDGVDTTTSNIKEINLSNTAFRKDLTNNNLSLTLTNFTKLDSLDISNSCVTDLILPSSPLSTFKINGSNIKSINLTSQPKLETVNFENCSKLETITINNCSGIKYITIDSLKNLKSINISNCTNISSVTLTNCSVLTGITLSVNSSLTTVVIDECTNANLNISISECPLERLTMTNILTSKRIYLPNKDVLSNLTTVNLKNSSNITEVQFGSDDIETYNDSYVLDFSGLENLDLSSSCFMNLINVKYFRFDNVEENPLEISNDLISGCTNIVRIFGNFKISESFTFDNLTNFYLNDSYPDTFIFMTGDTVTNLVFDSEANSYAKLFRKTNITIDDVNYIFKCLGTYCEKLTDISNMFNMCENIVTNKLNSNLFEGLDTLINIDSLFNGTNVYGEIPIDLIDNLTELEAFNYVFSPLNGKGYYISGDNQNICFFPENCKIKIISGFNPSNCDANNSRFYSQTLLRNLPELTEISDSFQGITLDFTNDTFTYNTKLQTINQSFNNNDGIGEFTNLLGLTNIVTIKNSFNFDSTEDNIIDIGNSLFKSVRGTLKEIVGTCFSGNVVKYINLDDCDGEKFPYLIFSGCTKLTSINYFFSNLQYRNEDDAVTVDILKRFDVKDDDDNVIAEDYGIMDGCYNLVDAEGLFSNMNINYTLSSDGFKNSKIKNFCSIFKDKVGYGKTGMIPYHLFYQKIGNIITNMNSAFANTNNTECLPYTCSDEVLNEYLYKDGEWNIYISDGTKEFYEKVEKYCNDNGLSGLPEELKSSFISDDTDTNTLMSSFELYYDQIFGYQDTSADKSLYKSALKLNYFCPPDIFNYCDNVSNLDINGCFNGAGGYDSDEKIIKGLRGRLCPYIFRPLTNIIQLQSVFHGLTIYPHKWGYILSTYDSDTDIIERDEIVGVTYPENLFDGLNSLSNLSGLFGSSIIFGVTKMPTDLLKSIGSTLTDISGMFDSCNFIDGFKDNVTDFQIPSSFFDIPSLTNISALFCYAKGVKITSYMFTSSINSNITNISRFMYDCTDATGTVPDFWNWSGKFGDKNTYWYAFKGLNEAISNYSNIPLRFRVDV